MGTLDNAWYPWEACEKIHFIDFFFAIIKMIFETGQ